MADDFLERIGQPCSFAMFAARSASSNESRRLPPPPRSSLALGLGANTALFAIVDAALLRPLPFAQGDDLVALRHRDVRTGLTKPDVAIGDFVDLRGRQRVLESLAGYGGFQGTLYGEGEPGCGCRVWR